MNDPESGGFDSFLDMLRSKFSVGDKFKHFAVLDAEEVKEFNDIEAERDVIRKMGAKLEARRQHFHTGLQLKYNATDKNLRINKELSSLEVADEEL